MSIFKNRTLWYVVSIVVLIVALVGGLYMVTSGGGSIAGPSTQGKGGSITVTGPLGSIDAGKFDYVCTKGDSQTIYTAEGEGWQFEATAPGGKDAGVPATWKLTTDKGSLASPGNTDGDNAGTAFVGQWQAGVDCQLLLVEGNYGPVGRPADAGRLTIRAEHKA